VNGSNLDRHEGLNGGGGLDRGRHCGGVWRLRVAVEKIRKKLRRHWNRGSNLESRVWVRERGERKRGLLNGGSR